MDYKEKYEQGIECIQEILSGAGDLIRTSTLRKRLQPFFPELAESEDEKIRKDLTEFIKSASGGFLNSTIPCKIFGKWLAWLEKYGDKKPTFNADDWYVSKVDGKIHNAKFIEKQSEEKPTDKVEHLIPQKGIYYTCIKDYYSANNTHLCVKGNIYKSSYNGYIDDESHFGLSWNSYAEKYFEPTKDEDWIVCEHDNVIGKPMQYKEFKEKINQNFIKNLKAQGITPKLRLWTIQDAKDGDVFVCNINKAEIGGDIVEKLPNITPTIYIYKNVVKDKDFIHCYCSLYDESSLVLQNTMYYNMFVYNIQPATKEQRELLFQKMEEAGYKWDSDKKELKKIGTKTLDPDNVIAWLNDQARLGWIEDIEVVEQFKKDFGL